MFDLERLNESQRAAVVSDSKRKAMIAGAGSGKTHTLVAMIDYDSQVIPMDEMVAITFTRFASEELKDRLIKSVGNTSIFTGTIHSFCLSILENHTDEIMRMDDFSLYDHDDKKDIVEAIIKEFKYKLSFNDYLEGLKPKCDAVAKEYEERMQIYNAIDLDMILDKTVELFENHPEVLSFYKSKITCIYLDEAQDSNFKQMNIIKLLDPKYLRLIGDPDQSIYEWNGANPEILNEIQDHFPGIKIFKLVENYRSTKEIIEKSNKVIRNNVNRIDKDLIAFKNGPEPEHKTVVDGHDEAVNIAEKIKEPYSDNAIICRTNSKAQALYDFLSVKYPCVLMTSSKSIYKKQHIKNIHRLMNSIMNPSDIVSFLMFCIGYDLMARKDADLILQAIVMENIAIEEKTLTPKIWALYKNVLYLNKESKIVDVYSLFSEILQRFYIVGFFSEKDRVSKVNDLEELRKKMKLWQLKQEFYGQSNSLKAYMRYVMLMDLQDSQSEKVEAIKIMTIHGSKGLEFERVFIPSINKNEFPSRQSDNEEEERRLLYVGMTRAKQELFTLSTETRELRNGITQNAGESKFIREIYD